MLSDSKNDVIKRVLNNDHRAISKVITEIESGVETFNSLHSKLFPYTKDSIRIGITGPPGAGKSTLTDKLVEKYLKEKKSVGVVAVDPSSPFTGGALLGDRVRMNNYIWNENVFIRSMGSQGNLGGLNRKSQEAGDVLAASGKDIVIYETVGVGQGEHEISNAADIILVVLVPESGDDVQLMKAGLVEIADIFVVNKSDRDGSDRLAQSIKNVLHIFKNKDKQDPPVFRTTASLGLGIDGLFNGIETFVGESKSNGHFENKRTVRYRNRVYNLVQEKLTKKFWTQIKLKKLDDMIKDLNNNQSSPYDVVNQILKKTNE